jgi:hypothetical protein
MLEHKGGANILRHMGILLYIGNVFYAVSKAIICAAKERGCLEIRG